jgi:hypothetical protein
MHFAAQSGTNSRTKLAQIWHKIERAEKGSQAFSSNLFILLRILVALPGLEPGLFALRGRRVNQLHHNATSRMRNPLRLKEV